MPVYILQEGSSHIFKIGRTKGSIDGVVRRLRTGNSTPLTLFDQVDTDQESACEAFFHRHLRSRRVAKGGGWEFFELAPQEMRSAIARIRRMFEELADARATIATLCKQECTGDLLEPGDEDRALLERLARNKEEQEYLSFENELIECKLKQRIGTAAGLRGIATWKTQVSRRYSEELFRTSAPDMYEEILERFHRVDTASWKRQRPEEYKYVQTTYYSPLDYSRISTSKDRLTRSAVCCILIRVPQRPS